ncbi:hypothetical protein BH18ACT5_BH18ACT5_00140 [soil metagenome]
MALTTLVRSTGLVVSAGHTPILTAVDLAVEKGECIGITGPNGSGKTTLLRVLATLRPPSGGTGEVLGVELGSPGIRSIRPRIGLLGHKPAFVPELTLSENLRFHASLRGRSAERADQLLEFVGLAGANNRKASESSVGMLRRADIGRLILGDPELLLLDEPTDGLDREARPLVTEAIADCLQRDGAVVIVSHDAANLDSLTSRIHRLEEGVLQ